MVGSRAGRSRPLRRLSPGPPSALAGIVAAEIKRKAQILSEHPLVGRAIKGRSEYRELVLDVANAKYVFRYVFDGKRLVLLRIFHTREQRD